MTQKKPQNNPIVDLMLIRLKNQIKKRPDLQKEIYNKSLELGFNKKGEINE